MMCLCVLKLWTQFITTILSRKILVSYSCPVKHNWSITFQVVKTPSEDVICLVKIIFDSKTYVDGKVQRHFQGFESMGVCLKPIKGKWQTWIRRVRIFWKGRPCHLPWIIFALNRCASCHLPPSCINISPDFSLKRQDLLPRKSGFVAAEIWICRLRNQILWRRECQRHSGGGIFSAFTAALPHVSLFKTVFQSTREMKIKEEISRQAVSIKPHSRLTNKVEVWGKHPNASLSQHLIILSEKSIECQCYCFDLGVLFELRG